MSEYLLINILTITVPLIMSFEKKLRFYLKYRQFVTAMLISSAFFLIWDKWALARGHWHFNDEFVSGLRLFGLPAEEYLFFLTTIYSLLFSYEAIAYYHTDKQIKKLEMAAFFILIISIIFTLLNYEKGYSSIVGLLSLITIMTIGIIQRDFFRSVNYWLMLIASYAPFMLINYFLTALPILVYHEEAINGYRIITIPIEDFWYSYLLLTISLFIYKQSVQPWKQEY